ncbi:MAG TPA: EAL domain-containing protein [Roseiflexaceae bacterium]|nr:EAL domain-containing protein [Roseiflexaceae bacterium]
MSVARLQALVEHSSELLAICDTYGVIAYLNPGGSDLLGYQPGELLGRSWLDIAHFEDADEARATLRAALQLPGRRMPLLCRIRHHSGVWRAFELTATAPDSHLGDALVLSGHDISDRETVQKNQEHVRQMIDLSPDVVLLLHGQQILFLNQTGMRLLGARTPEEIIGRSVLEFLTPGRPANMAEQIMLLLDGQIRAPQLYHLIGLDGTRHRLEVVASAIGDDGHPSVLVVGRDITTQTRVEERLRLLESVVVHAQDAVLVTEAGALDRPGPRIVYVNPAFTKLTGYTIEDVLGHTPRILQGPHTDPAQLQTIRRALEANTPVRAELVNYDRNGRTFWVDLSIAPVRTPEGEVTHYIAIQRDITARKLSEQLELDRAHVMELIGRDGPLVGVLDQIGSMVERQRPELRVVLALLREGLISTVVAPGRPPEHPQRPALDALIGQPWEMALAPGSISTLMAPDARWEPYAELWEGDGLSLCWAVPICSGAHLPLGVILAYRSAPIAPNESDRDLLALAVQFAALATERRHMHDQLRFQAHHDALTSLPNRYQLHEQLQQALGQARQSGTCVALLCIDLDRFKHINDTLGHPSGDVLLTGVAGRFAHCLRPSDTLARMGGDEFVVVVPDVSDRRDAENVGRRLLETLRTPLRIDGRELMVTASIGISYYPHDGTDATTLLKNADSALYNAKSGGRNMIACFAPELSGHVLARLDLEQELHRALERQELELYYQPQVDIATGQVVSLEALLRWKHMRRGLISPGLFVPLAEESGLILPIGEWVLQAVCRQIAAWRREGRRLVTVSVNVSARQFVHESFVADVARALFQHKVPAGLIELELTESVLMHDVSRVVQRLQELRRLGVRITIDGFGTGYSSLAYLQRLPLDRLKIDRSFVRALLPGHGPAEGSAPLVQAIVLLAHNLKLAVVAEGVEQPEHMRLLREMGCDIAQGFLFSPAVPSDRVWSVVQAIQPAA